MRHEFHVVHNSGVVRGSVMPLLAIALFCIFIIIAIINTFISSKEYEGELIESDVRRLAGMIQQIEKDCKILSFDGQKNVINFLNNKSFTGSEVGPVNLKHPDRWKGPYADHNPTMQGKNYLVVRTKKGYFVTPGEGVKLPNGKIVGTDINIDENADIEVMMKDDKMFRYKSKSLAVPLEIKKRAPYFVTSSPVANTI
jgi:hypothetical protein